MNKIMQKSILCLVAFMFVVYSPGLAKQLEIKIPITSAVENRDDYQIGILKLALKKANVPYKITHESQKWTQQRIIKQLQKGRMINLYWMGTSKELEKTLLPIRAPLYRGLLGYRIFIINKNDQKRFDAVKGLEDLRKMKAIQGRGWTDVQILEAAGLKTYVNKYDNIFKMVNRGGRVDYFPRGVNEAFSEVAPRIGKLPNLAVEKRVLLIYPFAMFFFTTKGNKELAAAIETGLKKSYEDGSFLKYFSAHPKIRALFEDADLNNRVRLEIKNPILSPESAAIPAKYWHKLK